MCACSSVGVRVVGCAACDCDDIAIGAPSDLSDIHAGVHNQGIGVSLITHELYFAIRIGDSKSATIRADIVRKVVNFRSIIPLNAS